MTIEEARAEVERVVAPAQALFGIEITIVGVVSNGKRESVHIRVKGPDGSLLNGFVTPGLPGNMTVQNQIRDLVLDSAYSSHRRRRMPDIIMFALDELDRKVGS